MPVVNVAYHPVNGSPLDVSGLNLDLYSTPAGDSILETSNGGLENANLDPGFLFRKQHFRRGEVIDASSAALRAPLDYYDNLWEGFEAPVNFVQGIPGACQTWHQRFPAGVAQVNFGIFTSLWRVSEISAEDVPPIISTKLFIDGVAVDHTRRDMPVTVFYENVGVGDIRYYISEAYSTRCRNQSHLLTGLSVGFHTAEVRVFVERVLANTTGDRNYTGLFGLGLKRADHGIKILKYNLVHRLRVGVRNMTVLRVL